MRKPICHVRVPFWDSCGATMHFQCGSLKITDYPVSLSSHAHAYPLISQPFRCWTLCVGKSVDWPRGCFSTRISCRYRKYEHGIGFCLPEMGNIVIAEKPPEPALANLYQAFACKLRFSNCYIQRASPAYSYSDSIPTLPLILAPTAIPCEAYRFRLCGLF